MSISQSSRKTYLSCINRLIDKKIQFNPIFSVSDLIAQLSDIGLKSNTIKSYLNAVLWYSIENKINSNHYDELRKHIQIISKTNQKALLQNLPNKQEKEKLIPWAKVLEIHNRLKQLYQQNPSDRKIQEYYLILSLYVYMPPRRILDYIVLYYNNTIIPDNIITLTPTIVEHNKNSTDDKNYYTKLDDKSYFIFNNYKTKQTYGVQCLEVNPLLATIIDGYIFMNNIEEGSNLLKINQDAFVKRLQKIFIAYTNKTLSASCLRHIYINHMRDNNLLKSGVIKQHLATQMAHSINMQDEYYKNMADCIIDCNISASGDSILLKKAGKRKVEKK